MAQDPNVRVRINGQDQASSTFQKVENRAKAFSSNVSGLIKAAFAGAAAMAIGDFLKKSVEASAESAKVWSDVAGAINNIGINANKVLPQVNSVVDALSNTSGMDDEDIAAAFANLVRRTGDYNEALKLLPQTLDVSAAHSMDLAAASETVAKAHEGNAKAAKMLMNTQGAAAAQGQTLSGTLGRLKTNWGNLQQAVGDAITGTNQFGKVSNFLVDGLAKLAKFIEENSGYLQGFFNVVQDVGSILVQAGEYVIDLGKRALGGVLSAALDHSQGLFQQFKDTLKLVVSGLYEFLKPVATVAGAIGKLLAPAVLVAWQGWLLILATASAGLGELGASAEIAFGKLLQGLSKFARGANKVLGIFGVHISDEFIGAMDQMGKEAELRGTTKLGEIEDKLNATLDRFSKGEYNKPNENTGKPAAIKQKVIPTIHATAPELEGDKDKAAAAEKKAFDDKVSGLKALLAIDSQRVNAQDQLIALAQKYKAIAEDSTKSEKERADAAERYSKAMSAGGFKSDADMNALNAQTATTDHPTEAGPSRGPQNFAQGFMASSGMNTKGIADVQALMDNAIDSVSELHGALGDLAGGALANLGDAFANAFQSAIDGSESLGQALIGAAKAAVAQEAMARGRLSFVHSAEALAQGIMGDPKAFIAAAKYAAAGTAYMSLAAAMGKGGGGGSGPGSAGATSGRNLTNTAKDQKIEQGTSTIVIKGNFLPNDPQFLDLFGKAYDNAKNNKIIIVHEP